MKIPGESRAGEKGAAAAPATEAAANTAAPTHTATAPAPVKEAGASVLTVSGYIVNRERNELSPRFMGVVK